MSPTRSKVGPSFCPHALTSRGFRVRAESDGLWCVAAGIEKVGLEEFEKGGFWKGELYIDNGKKIHKALHIEKVGILGSVKMMVTNKEVKEAIKVTKDTPGDFKGDGRQLGATFVLAKGNGDTLLDFRQAHFGDHPTNAALLHALGIHAH